MILYISQQRCLCNFFKDLSDPTSFVFPPFLTIVSRNHVCAFLVWCVFTGRNHDDHEELPDLSHALRRLVCFDVPHPERRQRRSRGEECHVFSAVIGLVSSHVIFGSLSVSFEQM